MLEKDAMNLLCVLSLFFLPLFIPASSYNRTEIQKNVDPIIWDRPAGVAFSETGRPAPSCIHLCNFFIFPLRTRYRRVCNLLDGR